MRFIKGILITLLVVLWTAAVSAAPNPASQIRLDVEEFRLENGMQFLVVERHTTPQVACRVAMRAGSALEETGKTGIAHLLEHMMFKGTKNFGTLDLQKDQALQERIEAAYQVVRAEKIKRHPNPKVIEAKLAEMEKLRAEVQAIYVPQAFSSQLGKNGAVGVNAFTTQDQTQYLASVPSDMIEQWFSIVSEQLFEPSWREFYVEKDVVQREWAFRYINNPEGAAWLDLMATAYTAHPYRNPVIGWKSDMENYTTRDAMAFHLKYYNPSNAVCVLVGDVTLDQAKAFAEIYFGRYPKGPRSPEVVTAEPEQEGPRRSVRFLKGARTPLVRVGYHGTRMGTDDFYALDALTMVLSYGRGSRMVQNIVEKGRAVNAWAANPDNRYAGMMILGGSPIEPDTLAKGKHSEEDRGRSYLKACEELEQILISEAEKLKEGLVSTRELERMKKRNQHEFLKRFRSNEALAGSLATLEVQVGWRYFNSYLERMNRVTPEDIRRVAKTYIRPENRTTVYVIPGGKPDHPPETYTEVRSVSGPAAAKLVKTDTSRNISDYPTPKGWKHPLSFERDPEEIHYPNAETAKVAGAMVFYLPDRELPLVDLTLLVKAGSVDVNAEKTGLSTVLEESIIRGGTDKYTPGELALVLDDNAIDMSVSVGEEATSISLSVMKEDWKAGLAALQEVLTRPRFDPGVLKVVKQEALIQLKRQGGDATAVAAREAEIWHFKGHPYGRDPLRGLETIPDISREDLTGFLRKHVVPSNMVVAVSGDIKKSEVIKGLEGLFGMFPKTEVAPRKLQSPPETPPVLCLVHKPGQVQSQVVFMLESLKRTDTGYWKLSLLMNIFGGNDSLLYRRLRDDMGLVYAAWFYQTYKWHAGMLTGYVGCKGDKTSRAVEETLKIMEDLQRDVPAEELELKRLDALNSFVFNVDNPTDLVQVYGRYYLRNEPLDTLERIQEAYMGAKKGELEALARKFLKPERVQIFVVADKNIRVKRAEGSEVTLEQDLMDLAAHRGLPYVEIPLR